jgi:hypothetical protein
MPRRIPALALFTVIGCAIAMDSSAQVVRQEVEGIRNFAKINLRLASERNAEDVLPRGSEEAQEVINGTMTRRS